MRFDADFAKILALADSLHKINENVTSWALLSVIDKTKKLIIEDEFINELKSTIINIDDIISSFRKMKVNLSFNELKRIVNSVDYKYATGDISESNLILKIRFLYEIGFIGITYESENIPIGQLHKNIFYFNEGISIFADNFLSEDDLINLKFSIHPLFWDYLKIDFTESDFLLEFTWDYLRKAENALIARM